MSGQRLTLFGGIIPRLGDRGLPDNAAQFAMNAKLYSGELRAWNRLRELATLPIGNAKTVFHYRPTPGGDSYLAFAEHTDVVKAPLINETLGRLYWTNSAGPKVNTGTRIAAAQPAFNLGVPPPTGAFTVVPTGGTAATATSRVYVVTVETAWGEESSTGTLVTANGNADGTWTINGLNALTIPTAYNANITNLRLYRTLSSDTGTDYRLVNTWPIGARPASYVDNITEVDLSDNEVLDSIGYDVPPSTLRGLIAVAGGFLAGFTGRTVRFSVPYQPHAWPEDYSYAVEDDIVALGVFGNTVVVGTEGRTYMVIGPSPDAMSLLKMEGVQPCLSARSMVSTSGGALFATTDGLVLVDGSSNRGQIVSRMWVTKDEWMSRFAPREQMASIYQDRYLAFYSDQLGLTVGFDDPVTGFTELQALNVQGVNTDSLTGQTLIIVGSKVYEWDGDTTGSLTYTWKSKPFLVPKPVNYGAIQLRADYVGGGVPIPPLPAQGIGGYSMNARATNGYAGTARPLADRFGDSVNGPPAWLAMSLDPSGGGSPDPGIAVKVYGDGILRWFGNVTTEKPYRMPSGYKAVKWEFEVQGTSSLYSIVVAETAKELERIP